MSNLFSLCQDLHNEPNSTRLPGGARMVAALYVKNELVSIGWNQRKTSPFQAQFGKNQEAIYLHAELHAIKSALRTWSEADLIRAKTTLFICRAKRTHRAGPFIRGLAKPCSGCMGALGKDWYKIKTVVYSLDQDKYGSEFEVLELR